MELIFRHQANPKKPNRFYRAATTAFVMFAACGGSGPSGDGTGVPTLESNAGAVVGTWQLFRPWENELCAELSFTTNGRTILKKRLIPTGGGSATLVKVFEGAYTVSGNKVTFDVLGHTRQREIISVTAAVAGNELAIGIYNDDDDMVLVPKVSSALTPVGSWVWERSVARYTSAGAVDNSTTTRADVDIMGDGTMSWTAIEEKVRSGVARPPHHEIGQGVWQEVSSGRYIVKRAATDQTGIALRLVGGFIATETAIFVRQ